jgi:MbtH protein
MNMFDDEDQEYQVVVNDEEQYSIWPTDRPVPSGWTAAGPSGSKQVCLDHIADVWTDMRPRSLREQMKVEQA